MNARLFDKAGKQLWQGDGLLKFSAIARQHGGVSRIAVERRRFKSMQAAEALVRVEYRDGTKGAAEVFSFNNAKAWAYKRAGDARSPFFCATVEISE